MLAALLALGTSLFYGSSDFLAGMESRRRSVLSIMAVSQPAAVLVGGVVLLLTWTPLAHPEYVLAAAVGGVFAAAAILLYYSALSSGTMSVVAPIAASSAAVPVLVGLASGERVDPIQYVGMALAVGGIMLTARAEATDGGRASLRSVLFAVAAAVSFGVVMVALSIGAEEDVYWSVFGLRAGSCAAVLAYLAVRRPRLDAPLRSVPVLALIGILGVVANLLFTTATTLGYLSVVAVLGSLSPVVVAVCARVFLHERLSRLQLFAALVVLAGVICLAAA